MGATTADCGSAPCAARITTYALALGVLLAGCTGAMVVALRAQGRLADIGQLAIVAALGAFAMVLFVVMRVVFVRVPTLIDRAQRINPLPLLGIEFNRRSIALCALVVFVCWLPWVILQYPCAMNGDTYNQIYQYQTHAPTLYTTMGTMVNAEFIDHHPVFDSLIFGSVVALGDAIGSENVALFVYSLLQSAIMASGVAASCCYLARLGVPKVFRLVSLAFGALFFPLALNAAVMVKDSLFAAFFVWMMICYIEAFRTRGAAFKSKGFIVAFTVLLCLCILTKKTGLYVMAPSVAVLALYCKGTRVRVFGSLAVGVVACCIAWPALVYPALGGVEPGGSQEMWGTLYQQTVTALSQNGDDIAESERSAIDGVLRTEDALAHYNPELVDPVKNRAKRDATTADRVAFLQAWAAIGLRHPDAYAESVARICGPLIAPGSAFTWHATCDQSESWISTLYNVDTTPRFHTSFYKPEPFKSASRSFLQGFRTVCDKFPFLFFFSRGFYGGWLPLICLLCAACNHRRYWIAFLPVLITFATLVVGPAHSARYVLPLVVIAPLMLGVLCESFAPWARIGAGARPAGRHAAA